MTVVVVAVPSIYYWYSLCHFSFYPQLNLTPNYLSFSQSISLPLTFSHSPSLFLSDLQASLDWNSILRNSMVPRLEYVCCSTRKLNFIPPEWAIILRKSKVFRLDEIRIQFKAISNDIITLNSLVFRSAFLHFSCSYMVPYHDLRGMSQHTSIMHRRWQKRG